MKAMKLVSLILLVVGATAQDPDENHFKLHTRYRTLEATAGLRGTVYWKTRICNTKESDSYVLSLDMIIPENPVSPDREHPESEDNQWDPKKGTVQLEVSSSQAYWDKDHIVATNYWMTTDGYMKQLPWVTFEFTQDKFKDGYVYIRAKSYASQTRLIFNIELTPAYAVSKDFQILPTGWIPLNGSTLSLVQYVKTDKEDGQVSGLDFNYYFIEFCEDGSGNPNYSPAIVANVIATDPLNQSAMNLIMCRDDTVRTPPIPPEAGCVNPGTPSELKYSGAAAQSITILYEGKDSKDILKALVVGVQGQGGYKGPDGDAVNEFELNVLIYKGGDDDGLSNRLSEAEAPAAIE